MRGHAVGVVLAHAACGQPGLGGRRLDIRDAPLVDEVVVHAGADEIGQVESRRARGAQLVGHGAELIVGLGEPRGLREAPVRAEIVQALAAVGRNLRLDHRPGHELDVIVDLLEREVEDDVPEAVVRALALQVGARDAQLVRREALVAVVVRRHDHQPLAEVGDRARVVVAERLLDQDGRLADVPPVDLVVVDAPEGGDQVAERD